MPIRVGLEALPPVLHAGLVALLARHRDRVLVTGARTGVDVVVFDPVVAAGSDTPTLAAGRLLALINAEHRGALRLARDLGARGVVSMSVSSPDLVRAVEQVHAVPPGGAPSRAVHRPGDPLRPGRAAGAGLTVREGEVVGLICRGFSNHEIADELFVSVNSVKTHIRAAYRKMGVTRRAQAVVWGLQHGLGV